MNKHKNQNPHLYYLVNKIKSNNNNNKLNHKICKHNFLKNK